METQEEAPPPGPPPPRECAWLLRALALALTVACLIWRPPSPLPRGGAAAAPVRCALHVGSAPGRWETTNAPGGGPHIVWSAEPLPPCAYVNFLNDSARATAAIEGRAFFFLGDSVARDLLVALQRAVAPRDSSGSPLLALTSHEGAKLDCQKLGLGFRGLPCAFELSGGGRARASFSWLQWWALERHIHAVGSIANPAKVWQEEDLCCHLVGTRATMSDCVTGFVGDASPRDVLVLRVGLNYLLFADVLAGAAGAATPPLAEGTATPAWEAALAHDLRTFLPTLRFPGIVVFLLLGPTLEHAHGGRCDGSGLWDSVFHDSSSRKSARANAIMAPLIRAAGHAVIDPMAFTTDALAAAHYGDCVHPDGELQDAAVNVLLNVIASG